MKKILMKPNKENITTFVSIGSSLVFIGFIDLITSTFLNINFTGFLPNNISFFTPLILGALGLYFIRIEFSGNKILDKINTNFNSNNFNAVLTLLVIFALIKYIPPLLNWFIFDANFVGNTKEDCTSEGACWVFVKSLVKSLCLWNVPRCRTVENKLSIYNAILASRDVFLRTK